MSRRDRVSRGRWASAPRGHAQNCHLVAISEDNEAPHGRRYRIHRAFGHELPGLRLIVETWCTRALPKDHDLQSGKAQWVVVMLRTGYYRQPRSVTLIRSSVSCQEKPSESLCRAYVPNILRPPSRPEANVDRKGPGPGRLGDAKRRRSDCARLGSGHRFRCDTDDRADWGHRQR